MGSVSRRIAINSGGAYVPGLNAVMAGAVLAANELGWEIVSICNGYEGLLFGDRYPNRGLTRLTPASVEVLLSGGGADLATSRVNPFHVRSVNDNYVEEEDRSDDLLGTARREQIDGVISVVGRRAMSVAWKLERKGLKTICVPESVENDVAATAYSFGFNSALEFTIELLDRIRTEARAAHKTAVVEVLGEHAGWLALQAGIATLADAILIPEIPYSLDQVCERLLSRARNGRRPTLVVVAEGARPSEASGPDISKDEALEAKRRTLSPGSTAEVILLHVFDAPPLVAAGFLIVSVCAGAPIAAPGTTVAGGDVPYAVGLMIVSAVLSVVLAPLLLSLLLARLPGAGSLTIDYVGISKTLLFSQIIPLGLALAFHRWKPDLAARLSKPADIIQNALVVAVVGCGLIAQWNQLAKFSLWAFCGMLLLVLIGTIMGWALGGPKRETRKALSFSTPQRNTGIAMVIASANFAGTPAVTVTVVLAVFLTLSGLVMQFVLRKL